MLVLQAQSVALDQAEELTDLVRLRLTANLLQVEELANDWMDEDVVAPARPPQLKAERLDQPPHVGEGDVREIAASDPRSTPERPVFPGVTQERLRTAIARACRASGTPTWSPHDPRHRRISLWHRQGETWALIGSRVGQRSLSVTADTYTHVLLDDRELDHALLLGQLGKRV